MDNRTRIALIVLLIVVPLFVAVVLWGLLKHDTSPRADNRKQTANSLSVPPLLHRIENWFSSLRPTLKLAQQTFQVPPGGSLGPILVPRAQKPSEKMRSGRFRLLAKGAQPSGAIVYLDKAAPTTETHRDLARQPIRFPAPADEPKRRDDPMAGTIVALGEGGTLTFSCDKVVACTFELIR